jgi:hypothetical protein
MFASAASYRDGYGSIWKMGVIWGHRMHATDVLHHAVGKLRTQQQPDQYCVLGYPTISTKPTCFEGQHLPCSNKASCFHGTLILIFEALDSIHQGVLIGFYPSDIMMPPTLR